MSSSDQSEGTWQRLSKVAVSGAEYDSAERLPHPKCLPGTRVKLLDHSYKCLDNREESRIVWAHGTAGVGKSAFAFTVAERMRKLKTDDEKPNEMRLAGTFFFSRSNAKRSTTAYFFATLAYQLAINFSSIKDILTEAINHNPALLQPTKSLREQMEALFLLPLRRLQPRLQNCPPLVFVIDALDECTSEHEIPLLILLLSQALRDSDIPVTHILVTSRSEAHVSKAIHDERVYPLVCEIPVKTSADDDTSLISLDGIDVDSDIVLFLKHSFADKQSSYSSFPQPTEHELWQLAKRAGRRFIIASTMMKFIDESDNCEPHDRFQLMLNLTCDLLPGTEVYELYNQIIRSCTDPKKAFLQLSVVVALVDPLPMSQISELLGFSHGKDTEKLLLQLRSIMDIPANNTLPVKISHSSVRDYVLEPSICSRFGGQVTFPHSLLASSSLHLMVHDIQKSTGLQDALLKLSKQSGTIRSEPAKNLRESLAFMTQRSMVVEVLTALIWLRGDQRPALYDWLDKENGNAWLNTSEGRVWQSSSDVLGWLLTAQGQRQLGGGFDLDFLWLESHRVQEWVQTYYGRWWLQRDAGLEWLQTDTGREWLQADGRQRWLHTDIGQAWLMINNWQAWLQANGMRKCQWPGTNSLGMLLLTNSGKEWLQTDSGREWLQTVSGRKWLDAGGQLWLFTDGKEWLQTDGGQKWLQTYSGEEWLWTDNGDMWLQTDRGQQWLQTDGGQKWLQTYSGEEWLQTYRWQQWLQTDSGEEWLQTYRWQQCQLQTNEGKQWLQTDKGQQWLQTDKGQHWLQTDSGREWRQTFRLINEGQQWLQTDRGQEWLQTNSGREWLHTDGGQEWLLQTNEGSLRLQINKGQEWLQTDREQHWLKTMRGRLWLQTDNGREWLQTDNGREWLQTDNGREWLQTNNGQEWLQTNNGREWVQKCSGNWLLWSVSLRKWLSSFEHWPQTDGREWWQTCMEQKLLASHGKEWLQTNSGREWLQTFYGYRWVATHDEGWKWLQTDGGREWLRTDSGRKWLRASHGDRWLDMHGPKWFLTLEGSQWLYTNDAQRWLQTNYGKRWLQTIDGCRWATAGDGQTWLQTDGGRQWLRTDSGRKWLGTSHKDSWLETNNGQEWLTMWGADWWLQTDDGKQWLQTLSGKMWMKTTQFHKPLWIQIEEFLLVVQAINNFDVAQQLSSHTTFQVIQQFKSLPDFLMFPAFLSFTPDHPTSETTLPLPHDSPIEIIRAMNAFVAFTDEAKKRSRLASGTLIYACRNWAIHLSQASNPWDDTLNHKFNLFWERHLLSWLETQWCLSGLQSCLTILSDAQMFVKQKNKRVRSNELPISHKRIRVDITTNDGE